MIYTDGVHLIATCGTEELHQFAEKIGLKREWFQDHRHPHYDLLSQRIKARALREGARLVDKKRLVRIMKAGEKHADKN